MDKKNKERIAKGKTDDFKDLIILRELMLLCNSALTVKITLKGNSLEGKNALDEGINKHIGGIVHMTPMTIHSNKA